MRKYITLVGRNYWTTLNSLWAVIKEDKFTPDEVYILTEKSFKERAETLKEDVENLLKNYDIDAEVFIEINEDADLYHAGEEVQKIIGDGNENEVALDITGGRKTMVAGSLVNPRSKSLKHVFYLYSDEAVDTDKPYPAIDSDRMLIKDFVDMYRGEM
mgnify:CR=1 FL=1